MEEDYVPTWAPCLSYQDSVQVLRDSDLKECIETCYLATDAILSEDTYQNPVIDMWSGYGTALCAYALYACQEAKDRPQVEDDRNMLSWFVGCQYLMSARGENIVTPEWWYNETLRESHRYALNTLDPDHYQFTPVAQINKIVWPGVSQHNSPKLSRGIFSKEQFCECSQDRQLRVIRTKIGNWWYCSTCSNPLLNWVNAAKHYLPEHTFRGGRLNDEILTTNDVLSDPNIMASYTFQGEIVEDLFLGSDMFLWKAN